MFNDTDNKLWVSQESLKAASGCPRGHACLSGRYEDMCSVVSTIDDEIIFVSACTTEECPFQNHVNGRNICGCSVRKELYTRYGK